MPDQTVDPDPDTVPSYSLLNHRDVLTNLIQREIQSATSEERQRTQELRVRTWDLEAKCSDLERENEELRAQLRVSSSKLVGQDDRNAHIRAQLDDTRDKLDKSLAELSRSRETSQSTIDGFQSRCLELEKSESQQKESIAEIDVLLNRSMSELEAKGERLATVQSQLDESQRANAELQSHLDATLSNGIELQSRIDTLMHDSEARDSALQSRVSELNSQMLSLDQTVAELRVKNDNVLELQEQLTRMTTERDDQQKLVTALETTRSELRDQVEVSALEAQKAKSELKLALNAMDHQSRAHACLTEALTGSGMVWCDKGTLSFSDDIMSQVKELAQAIATVKSDMFLPEVPTSPKELVTFVLAKVMPLLRKACSPTVPQSISSQPPTLDTKNNDNKQAADNAMLRAEAERGKIELEIAKNNASRQIDALRLQAETLKKELEEANKERVQLSGSLLLLRSAVDKSGLVLMVNGTLCFSFGHQKVVKDFVKELIKGSTTPEPIITSPGALLPYLEQTVIPQLRRVHTVMFQAHFHVEELKLRAAESERHMRTLHAANTKFEADAKKLCEEKEQVQQRLVKAEADLRKAQSQEKEAVKSEQQMASACSCNTTALEENLAGVQSAKSKLQADLNTLLEKQKALQGRVSKLESEKKELVRAHSVSSDELKATVTRLAREKEGLEKDVENARRSIGAHQSTNTDLRNKISTLEWEKRKLEEVIESYRFTPKEYQDALGKLLREKEEAEKLVKEVQSSRDATESTNAELRKTIATLESEKTRTEKETETVRESRDKVQSNDAERKAWDADLRSQICAKDAELASLRLEMTAIEEKLRRANQAKEETQKLLEGARTQLTANEDNLQKKRRAIKEADIEKKQLTRDRDRQTSQLKKAGDDVVSIQEKLNEETKAKKRLAEDIEQIKTFMKQCGFVFGPDRICRVQPAAEKIFREVLSVRAGQSLEKELFSSLNVSVIDRISTRVQILRKELYASDEAKTALEKKLKESKTTISSLEPEVRDLKAQLSQVKDSARQLRERNCRIAEELRSLKEEKNTGQNERSSIVPPSSPAIIRGRSGNSKVEVVLSTKRKPQSNDPVDQKPPPELLNAAGETSSNGRPAKRQKVSPSSSNSAGQEIIEIVDSDDDIQLEAPSKPVPPRKLKAEEENHTAIDQSDVIDLLSSDELPTTPSTKHSGVSLKRSEKRPDKSPMARPEPSVSSWVPVMKRGTHVSTNIDFFSSANGRRKPSTSTRNLRKPK